MGYLSEKDKKDVLDILTPEDTSLGVVNSNCWEAIAAYVGGSEIHLWSSEADDRKESHTSFVLSGGISFPVIEDIRECLVRNLDEQIRLMKSLKKAVKKSLREAT